MRKLSIGLLSLALAAVVFTSCKEEEKAAPVITLANIADSVAAIEVTADNYTLPITITSEAGLKEVKISVTKNGTTTTDDPITSFEDEANYTNQYAVTGIPTAGIKITISATDKDDQNVTREITITKKETSTPLTTVTFVDENSASIVGAGGSNYGSYVDLDGGKIWHSTPAKGAQKATIDVIFDQSSLSNNDAGSSAPAFAAGTGTNLKVVTVDYATANSATLAGLSVTSNDKVAAVSANTVVYFETATNKGLILVKTFTTIASNKNEITIEAKIMAK